MKKASRKVKKQRKVKAKQPSGNRRAFDQLLDDAIFGVKPKAPRS